MAIIATRPIVSPTAPPVPSPPLPFLLADTVLRLAVLGGAVGVDVTVLTIPVTVSTDITGVGVHVEEVAGSSIEVDAGMEIVAGVVGVVDVVTAATVVDCRVVCNEHVSTNREKNQLNRYSSSST